MEEKGYPPHGHPSNGVLTIKVTNDGAQLRSVGFLYKDSDWFTV